MSEDTFVRELERRADQVHPRHLGFEDVRRSARRIQRRRRVAVAGGVAVAVAAAVLVPTALLGGSPRSQAPDPAPPTPSGSTAVLHDGQVTLPDGSRVEVDLDNQDVTQFGVLSDGRIVAAVSRPQSIQVFSPAGDLAATYPVPYNVITMSPDDHLVAWVDKNTRVQVLESGVAEPTTFDWGIPMPGESIGTIDAVYGSDCAHDGCTVLGGDGSTTTTRLSQLTEPGNDLTTSEPLRITDVSPDGGLWAVSYASPKDEQFGCSGIYDDETSEMAVRNCHTSNLRFAPDGEHLLGMQGDNAMFGQVEVYDTGLQQVMVYDPKGKRVVKAAAWADESHLFVVTADLSPQPEWFLLRVPIDGGEPETVLGPVDGPNPENSSAFLLSD
jgi:hypothetical protein